MKTFPMFLQMAGRKVVILGGGEQGAQKVRLFAKTAARIDVYAPDICDELAQQHRQGAIRHLCGPIPATALQNAALVIIGTGCCMNDRVLHAYAKSVGAGVVNVVDQPALCDAITPSIVDRDPVVVAIGTEGTAPVLGRQIKTRLEEMLEPGLGDLAALVGRLRGRVADRFGPRDRRDFYGWVFRGAPRDVHGRDPEAAQAMIEAAIDAGSWETARAARVSLVAAEPGARDLISLRGVQRLQEADLVLSAPGLDAYFELARRDADRGFLDPQAPDVAVQLAQGESRVAWLVPRAGGAELAERLGAEWVP